MLHVKYTFLARNDNVTLLTVSEPGCCRCCVAAPRSLSVVYHPSRLSALCKMVIMSSEAKRYFSHNRTMLVTKSRVAWRHRTKKKQVKTLTPAEKKKLSEQRQEKKENIAALLNSALAVVWKEAQGLFEATGTHSAKFWFEKLMQHSGKKRSAWQTSRWNAFLSKEMKARNDGALSCTKLGLAHGRLKQS